MNGSFSGSHKGYFKGVALKGFLWGYCTNVPLKKGLGFRLKIFRVDLGHFWVVTGIGAL